MSRSKTQKLISTEEQLVYKREREITGGTSGGDRWAED